MEKVAAEQQVKPERGAQKFSQVGGQRRQFGSHPQANRRATREMLPAILRQRGSGSDAQFGGQILDEDGHQVRPQQHPKQLVPEPRPGN